jgi:hypothetical protein
MNWEENWIVFPQSLGMWGLCQIFDVKQAHAKSDKCFFVGYTRETKGYYFYNKAEGKVFVTHNGVFTEEEFLSKGVSGSKVQLEEVQKTSQNVSALTDPI